MKRKGMLLVWILIGLVFVAPPAVLLYLSHEKKVDRDEIDRQALRAAAMQLPSIDASTLRIPEAEIGKVVRIGNMQAVRRIRVSRDGRKALSLGMNNSLALWDLENLKELRQLGTIGGAETAAFSPDSQIIVVGSWNVVQGWNASDGSLACSMSSSNYAPAPTAIAVSPNQQTILTSGNDGLLRIWNVRAGHELGSIHQGGAPRQVAYSPDGQRMYSVSAEGDIRAFDIFTAKQLFSIEAGTSCSAAAFSPDGRFVLLATGQRSARLCKLEDHTVIELPAHEKGVVDAVGFSHNGSLMITGAGEELILWETLTRRQIAKVRVPQRTGGSDLCILPTGRHVVIGGINPGIVALVPSPTTQP